VVVGFWQGVEGLFSRINVVVNEQKEQRERIMKLLLLIGVVGEEEELGGGDRVTRLVKKNKNFVAKKERQLTRSILAILEDPICGN
jgi:hypothetical protein